MTNDYYQLALNERRRLLTGAGFVRDDLRVWAHRDGRAVGEGIAAALTDHAFCRFLRVDLPAPPSAENSLLTDSSARTNAIT